ncbi:MAG: peptidoglycan-binding domain-containing protein, partial [Chloroflexota bacterium]
SQQFWMRCIFVGLFASLLLAACANQEQAVSPTAVATDETATVPSEPQATTVPATNVPAVTTEPRATVIPATEIPDISEATPDTAAPAPEAIPPGATTPALERSLALQEPRLKGDDVQSAQQQLEALGYAIGEVDGIYGPQTEAATRAFQARNSLTVDGIVGPQTWEQLFSDTALAAGESDVVPIVDARTGWLLGGSSGDVWFDMDTAGPLLAASEEYRLYGLTEQQGTATGIHNPPVEAEPCEGLRTVGFTPVPGEASILALGGDWDALPRVPVEEGTDSEVYKQAVAELLQAQGITEPEVQIEQVIRIDLEGDGTDEVLISATRLAELNGVAPASLIEAGDYSLVMLRKMIDGEVTNIFVNGESYTEAKDSVIPNQYRVGAILDTNGNGQMEFAVEIDYYEGAGTELYRVNGEQSERLLSTGCSP